MNVFLFLKKLKKWAVFRYFKKSFIIILLMLMYFIFLIIIRFKSNSKSVASTITPTLPIISNKTYTKKNLTSLPFKPNPVNYKGLNAIFDSKIDNNTVLIFENSLYHQECTPGYTKYFLELGYKVDIIFDHFGLNSFCLFEDMKNIRIFTFYSSLYQMTKNPEKFRTIFKNYSYILIESTEGWRRDFYEKLGLFERNSSIFLVHGHGSIEAAGILIFSHQNRVWSIGNLQNTLFVKPHYFGKINLRKKNNRTTFFVQSNGHRNYTYITLAAEKLKKENLDFEVIVIGKGRAFSYQNINNNLKDNFKFKYSVSFIELYKSVDRCDFIIINLYPVLNDEYRTIRVTGAAQLSYGFLKPALIHKGFADFYNMSAENSLIFDDNNFYEVMREAILLTDEEYQQKQNELINLSERLYNISLHNVNKTINSIQS